MFDEDNIPPNARTLPLSAARLRPADISHCHLLAGFVRQMHRYRCRRLAQTGLLSIRLDLALYPFLLRPLSLLLFLPLILKLLRLQFLVSLLKAIEDAFAHFEEIL